MLEFTNPETAKQYKCFVEKDRTVHKAGLYSGQLSNITPEMAAAMVEGESNLVREKNELEQSPSEAGTDDKD